ncbi:MAG: S1C family serine protease [Alphaproteobacteria bacterium]
MKQRFPRKGIAAVLAAIFLLAATAGPAGAARLSETIRLVKRGVVGVGTFHEIRRPPTRLLGTGFVVGDGTLVVTNNHVIDVRMARKGKEYHVILVGTGKTAEIRRVEVIARDPVHDVAILRQTGNPLPALRIGDAGKVVEGQEIAFTGFPIGAVLGLYPVSHRGIISARTPIAVPPVRPRHLDPTMIKRLRRPFTVFQLDATAYPGNSGSPLYDPETGEVYGIISSVFIKKTKEKVLSDPSGITFAVPISYARALLDKIGRSKK